MNAHKYFSRLLMTACFAALLFGAAIVSPLAVGRLLAGLPLVPKNDLLLCLFMPTSADWPSHVVSYGLAGLLLVSGLSGSLSLLRQWYRTRCVVRTLLRLSRPLDEAVPVRIRPLANLHDRIDFISAEKYVAFCYGWVRPRICLSMGAIALLESQELEALVLHEYYHLLRRDPLKASVTRALANAFFFLPVVRALHEQYLVAKEIEADEYALGTQGSERPLLGALYKLLSQRAEPGKNAGLAVAGGNDAINQRLDYLLDGRVPASSHLPAIFTSSFVITAVTTMMVFTTWAAATSSLWHQAHSGLGGC